MLDGGIVGTASVIITADTSAFKSELEASSAAGMAGVESDVGASTGRLEGKLSDAGMVGGTALSNGLSTGAKDIGKDTEKDLEASTGRMQNLVKDSSNKMGGFLNNLGVPKALTTGFGLTALGLAGVSAFALKAGVDLQTADSSIATSEGISTSAAKNIGNAFLTTAGQVEFSAKDQATAFATVAGQLKTTEGHVLSSAQSLTFMKANMDLATASGQDLGMVTQTTAGIMQAFQLPLSAVTTVTNTLFNASNATGQSIDTLGASFEKIRAKLGSMAPPLTDLASLMLDMTKNGITGRAALTGLNTAFTALQGAATGTTKANIAAKQTLADYGIATVDANGKLVPMSVIIDKLGPKFATMTQAQQLATATTIFGASAAKQMTAVIDGGTAVYQRSVDAIQKHNAVQDAAALKAQTLSVEWKTAEATLDDFAADLGQLLIPAFGHVVGAITPVLKGMIDVVDWFKKGSGEAHAVEIVLASILAPALVKMGGEFVTSAGKAVASFVLMSGSATTTATTVATETAAMDSSMVGVGGAANTMATEVEAADGRIDAANATTETGFKTLLATAGASLTGIIAKYGAAGIIIGGILTAKKAIQDPSSVAPGGLFGIHALGGAPNLTTKQYNDQGYQTTGGQWLDVNHAKEVAALDDATNKLSLKKVDTFAKQFQELNKHPEKNKSLIQELIDQLTGKTTGGTGFSGAQKAGVGVTVPDAYIKPINTAAQKASESAAKSAAAKIEEAAKKAQSEAAKAASTLTSEVLTAIKLPADEATKSLVALGVPAKRASAVLHDAVLPFTDAVKALEKAGFDAKDAVKIAEAGAAEVAKANKAAAAAATKAVATATTSIGTLMINGIDVSGAVYRAAIGAAYKLQTGGANLNVGIPSVAPTAGIVSAPPAPAPTESLSRGVVLNIGAGAVVIHPAAGNDAASLAKTSTLIDQAMQQMLRKLAAELRGGANGLQVIR